MTLKENIDTLLSSREHTDRVAAFEFVFRNLNRPDVWELIRMFLKRDPWLFDKIHYEREDENYIPFLKSVFANLPIDSRPEIISFLNNTVDALLTAGYFGKDEQEILRQILDLVGSLKWGLDDYFLTGIININYPSTDVDELKEQAGNVFARYPLIGQRRAYWEKIDFAEQEYLVYPYLFAYKDEDYLTTFRRLRKVVKSPVVHTYLQSQILRLLGRAEADIQSEGKKMLEFSSLLNQLPNWLQGWMRQLVRQFPAEYKFLHPLLVSGTNLASPEDFFRSYLYFAKDANKKYKYIIYPIYDLNILRFIDHEKIHHKFKVSLEGFTMDWEKFNVERSHSDVRRVEINSQFLMDKSTRDKNQELMTFPDDSHYRPIDDRELLIVIPRQLVNQPLKEFTMDIGVANLFQTAFIINTTLEELTSGEEGFNPDSLPKELRENKIIRYLYALSKKKYILTGYDREATRAMENVFELVKGEYGLYFSDTSDDEFLIPKLKKQEELTDIIINKTGSATRYVIATTGPVLASADKNNTTFLFNLQEIKSGLRKIKSFSQTDKVDKAFIHTSLHINSETPDYRILKPEGKKEIQRLFSMLMYTVQQIRENSEKYIEFIRTEMAPELSTENIRFAWYRSYVYNDPDEYMSLYHSNDGQYYLNDDKSSSRHIFRENQSRFDTITSQINQIKNRVIQNLKQVEHNLFIENIYNQFLSYFRKNRFLINFYSFPDQILDGINVLFENAVKGLNEMSENDFEQNDKAKTPWK